ncbi:hypothetical protein NFI96_034456 [Prochilodus magdalenae]|nr:hypothetical protein NFI96_034456 [Prochilodus magdalenae]
MSLNGFSLQVRRNLDGLSLQIPGKMVQEIQQCALVTRVADMACICVRFDPYGKSGFATCRICKSSVHQPGSHYCQGCAYKKGICAMCGKKVLDTKNYKQTSV